MGTEENQTSFLSILSYGSDLDGTLSDQGNKTKNTNFENYLSVKMMNYRMKHVLRRILFHKTNSLSDYPTTKEKKKHFSISKQNVCLLQLIPHNFG